jgi:hypothetical protein
MLLASENAGFKPLSSACIYEASCCNAQGSLEFQFHVLPRKSPMLGDPGSDLCRGEWDLVVLAQSAMAIIGHDCVE